MSFNSLQFLIFFPVVTALYFATPAALRWALLLAASCVFYMAFVPAYILILGGTIVIDYFAGLAIAAAAGPRRRVFLLLSLFANIGTLAFFKYYNFFAANVSRALDLAHLHVSLPLLGMLLPIGLSFHTFQAMSYTIEVYRGRQAPERHFGVYALYVMFYPQLVAGPIERPQNLLPQFHARHDFNYDNARHGLQQMAWGFFKKSVVADQLAVGVNTVFQSPGDFQGPHFILAALMFAIVIYCDFSGYTDIALGAARVMGFDLMRNFNNPYLAANITEFWQRWHISLSTWFRDYVYMPLSWTWRNGPMMPTRSNPKPLLRTSLILMFTMLLCGLWHGAGWNYVTWGGIHGTALAAHKVWLLFKPSFSAARGSTGRFFAKMSSHVLTLGVIFLSLIFFRAHTTADALYMVSHLFGGMGFLLANCLRPGVISQVFGALGFYREEFAVGALAAALVFLVEFLHERVNLRPHFERSPVALRWAAYYVLIGATVFYGSHSVTQKFIYFQF